MLDKVYIANKIGMITKIDLPIIHGKGLPTSSL